MSGLEIVTVSWLEAAELMYQSGPPLLIVNNSDPNSVGKPIDIRSALAQLRHLQADFDGTLTTGKSHWLLLSKVFPDAAHSASTVLPVVEYDRRLFMEGRPERPELAETNPWAARAVESHQNLVCVLMRDLERIVQTGLLRENFEWMARCVEPRDGLNQFCALFDHKVIVSAGIYPVIAEFVRIQELGAEVAATDFRYDNIGGVIGYDFVDVIHPGNKDQACWTLFERWWKEGLSRLWDEAKRTLRIGDSPVYDARMFQRGFINALIIPSDDQVGRGQPVLEAKVWDNLTFIYRGDSLLPLAELIAQYRAEQGENV